MKTKMNLSRSCKIARAMAGYTQADLADKADIIQSRISDIERNKFTKSGVGANTIQALADAFEVSVSEFIALGEG